MKPNTITLHHSLTLDSGTVSWGAIRNYHTKTRHWSDIGYHFGIEDLRGQTEILIGRMPDRVGAHVAHHNYCNIGICFVGNFDVDPVPVQSWDAGVRLCKYLTSLYGIKEIKGHRDFNPSKSCPGKNFNIQRFRRDVFL